MLRFSAAGFRERKGAWRFLGPYWDFAEFAIFGCAMPRSDPQKKEETRGVRGPCRLRQAAALDARSLGNAAHTDYTIAN